MRNTCKSPHVSSRSYLHHLCQTFRCLLFSNGTQMKFNLLPRRDWGGRWILFESQGDFCQIKNVGTALGIRRSTRQEEQRVSVVLPVRRSRPRAARLFPYDVCTLLFKLSVVAAEAVSWFYTLNLTENLLVSAITHTFNALFYGLFLNRFSVTVDIQH